ncbi:hypothetical protein J6590_003855 [Homalodisca vitripennis]|nr:hypothetical protein J6590_003855 [Homalodisca vitripennis]
MHPLTFLYPGWIETTNKAFKTRSPPINPLPNYRDWDRDRGQTRPAGYVGSPRLCRGSERLCRKPGERALDGFPSSRMAIASLDRTCQSPPGRIGIQTP